MKFREKLYLSIWIVLSIISTYHAIDCPTVFGQPILMESKHKLLDMSAGMVTVVTVVNIIVTCYGILVAIGYVHEKLGKIED